MAVYQNVFPFSVFFFHLFVYNTVNNSIQQQKDTAQRLEELEQQLNIGNVMIKFAIFI